MNHLNHKTYQRARDLILASEGRTLEDEIASPKDPICIGRALLALGGDYGLSGNGNLFKWDELFYTYPKFVKCTLYEPLHLQRLETIEKIVEILEANQK